MPELPEVETIKKGLDKHLKGHTIQDVLIYDPLRVTGSTENIIGSTVIGVQRRGKGLLIKLDNTYVIAVHVKMTGQLIYQGDKTKEIMLSQKVKKLPNTHTRVLFTLDGNASLFYNDIRRFGWLHILPHDKIKSIPFFRSLGPEPFGEGTNRLSIEYFSSLVRNSTSPIKTILLDQHKIGGIGNIYANDALYEAKIDPRRLGNSLTKEELKTLFEALHSLLLFSIKQGGASDTNFVNALGQDGTYQEYFKVYGRKDMRCKNCRDTIKRIVLAGRATFICLTCQK